MNERDPSEGYKRQHYGQHPGQFEVESRVWGLPSSLTLVHYATGLAPRTDADSRVTITATKPDARVALRLTIGYAPEDAEVTLDTVGSNLLTVRQNLAKCKIWLAECDDFGGGLRECGDLFGTDTTPIQFIADGNWGAIFEVDVDCKAVRARVDLRSPCQPGRFLVTAKWVGVTEMSENDWMRARERMQVVRTPQNTVVSYVVSP